MRYPRFAFFGDSRGFAEEWTYRFLSSALADVPLGSVGLRGPHHLPPHLLPPILLLAPFETTARQRRH